MRHQASTSVSRRPFFEDSFWSRLHRQLATEYVGLCCTGMPLVLLSTAAATTCVMFADRQTQLRHSYMLYFISRHLEILHQSSEWCKRRCTEDTADSLICVVYIYVRIIIVIIDTNETKLMAFEMRRYKRILHMRWQQMIANEEVQRRVKMPAKRHPDSDGRERKLNLFGHVCRMNNSQLIKPVVFGTIRWDWNPRKTQQRMARKYQGVVSDGHAFSKHLGTIRNRM